MWKRPSRDKLWGNKPLENKVCEDGFAYRSLGDDAFEERPFENFFSKGVDRILGIRRRVRSNRRFGNRVTVVSLVVLVILGIAVHIVNNHYNPDGAMVYTEYDDYQTRHYYNKENPDSHDDSYNHDSYRASSAIRPQYHEYGTGRDEHFTPYGLVTVTFLDVGQGSSIVVHTDYGTVLIDASWDRYAYRIISYLESRGIDFIDMAVATHPHADHIGGFVTVFDAFGVGVIYKPNVTHTTRTFERFLDSIEYHQIPVHFASAGDIFMIGPVEFYVVSPSTAERHMGEHGLYSNLNNASVVINMTHFFNSFLFTGDAEREAEEAMIYHGRNLQADVLKVAHHGSQTSTTEAFLSAVSPKYAVIQVGGNNEHGHPHDAVSSRLARHGVNIFRTDIHGNVRFYSDGFNLLVVAGVD